MEHWCHAECALKDHVVCSQVSQFPKRRTQEPSDVVSKFGPVFPRIVDSLFGVQIENGTDVLMLGICVFRIFAILISKTNRSERSDNGFILVVGEVFAVTVFIRSPQIPAMSRLPGSLKNSLKARSMLPTEMLGSGTRRSLRPRCAWRAEAPATSTCSMF